MQTSAQKEIPPPIRIQTSPWKGGDNKLAWLEGDKSFKATSTNSEESAARNLSYRHFFGTAIHRHFPDAAEKVKVRKVGPNLYEGTYTP